jgi:OmpA-OmpF porin, OOP family
LPQRIRQLSPNTLALLAFILAATVMVLVAYAAARVIERRSDKVITNRLASEQIDWIEVEANGLQIHLTGTAPNEADRFRAVNLIGSIVDSSRIRDGLDVTPASAIQAPSFSVQMLRTDDGIQLFGLMPEDPGDGGITETDLAAEAAALTPGADITNILEAAAYPAPPTWNAALGFGIEAMKRLKRSKISVGETKVEITAISDSDTEKRLLETEIRALQPDGVELLLEISAPRPVITPFTMRFVVDAEGPRFDSCSADTERARDQILTTASSAGVTGRTQCSIGLGTPTPRWADAVILAIAAVKELGSGSITFSDADVTLLAGSEVTQAAFDRVVGELETGLPDVFSLTSTLEKKETSGQGPAEFTAKLGGDGKVELRGRLTDEMQRTAVDAFARAAFGNDVVRTATRLDDSLPDGWPVRVLAGLEALAELDEGTLLVRADLVEITGVTGSQQARSKMTQILSGKLGPGQTFKVNVRYDEALDPLASIPTPEECAADVNAVIARTKITFTPASAEIASTARPVLDALAAILKACPAMTMEIGGYTDAQGSEGGNQALSQARAEAVLVALQGRRIDISGMTAVGYGEANPIADNETDADREANRRIEFVLKGAHSPTAAADAGAAQGSAEVPSTPTDTPDLSSDTSPSVAPTDKTIRPLPRPAGLAAEENQ